MFHSKGAFAPFDGARDLVLAYRQPGKVFKRDVELRVLMWLVLLVLLLLTAYPAWSLWQSFASDPRMLAKLDALTWHTAWQALMDGKTTSLLQLVFILVIVPLQFLALHYKSKSKLIVSQTHLHHQSGLPQWLGSLTRQNWNLALDDFRSGRAIFTLTGPSWTPNPLLTYALQWKPTGGFQNSLVMKHLNVAGWCSPGEPAREPIKAPSLWPSLAHWTTPEGQALLQNAFNQLPLTVALRARGIPLPALGSAKHHKSGYGVDLFAYQRLKVGVIAFFGLLLAAGLGDHFMRHQHFFSPPDLWVWAACGACCGAAIWVWLAQERDEQVKSLIAYQGPIAGLVAVACTLLAPSALLAASVLLYSSQTISTKLAVSPLSLQPVNTRIPPIHPKTVYEFRGSLQQGSSRQMSVRQGLFCVWQYESAPLEDEVYQFYAKQPSR